MTTSQPQMGGIVSRAVALALFGAVTCLPIWLMTGVGNMPTAAEHAPGQTYLPDGLYLATVLSLLVAFVVTVASDFILGVPSWGAFFVGFVVGLVIFLWNIPWTNVDYGAGEMFGIGMWWLPPMLGTVLYVVQAVRKQ
ncbi:hypothetical protein [Rhodococcus pyridinivorans]